MKQDNDYASKNDNKHKTILSPITRQRVAVHAHEKLWCRGL